MNALRPIALAVVVAASVAAVLVVALQRRLLYFPTRMPEAPAVEAARRFGLAPWRDAAGGFRGWRSASPARPRARALVLGGNAGSALDRVRYVEALAPLGLDVALLEYPGYGPRAGAPSLGALTDAAVDAVDALAREGGPVWLIGESLGSGVAGRAAAERPDAVRGLFLVTPFADLGAVARLHVPLLPAALLRDRFRPARDLAAFRRPAIVLVAGRDEVVSAGEGRRLFAALPGPKRLVEQPEATHNALALEPGAPIWGEVVAFLDAPQASDATSHRR